jgi:hypothetical protein
MLAPQSMRTGRMLAYHAAGLLSLTPQLQVTSHEELSQSGSYEVHELQLQPARLLDYTEEAGRPSRQTSVLYCYITDDA